MSESLAEAEAGFSLDPLPLHRAAPMPTNPPIVPSDGIYGFALAMTIRPHVPSAVPRPDEAICGSGGGVPKNFGVINRINSVQAAREHKPAALARVVAAGRPSSGRDAENS
jgi:hypothetical protein